MDIIFTTSELSYITGKPSKNLYTWKSRGKLIKNAKGWPYDNDINKFFIESIEGCNQRIKEVVNIRNKKKVETKPKQQTEPPKKAIRKKPENKVPQKKTGRPKNEKQKPDKVEYSESEQVSELTKITLEQKKLSNQKAKAEFELKQIELEQKKGSLISLEKTVAIASTYSDKLKHEMLQSIENLIQDICARHSIDSGKAGEYKLKVADMINKSNDSAIQELLKNFS